MHMGSTDPKQFSHCVLNLPWETGSKTTPLRTTVTQNHSHEGPPWPTATVMRDHPDPQPLSWVTTLTHSHCQEEHPDPKALSWGTTLSQKHCHEGPPRFKSTHEGPPWSKTTVTRDHPDPKPLSWGTTLIQNHCHEGPPCSKTTHERPSVLVRSPLPESTHQIVDPKPLLLGPS